MRQIRISHTLRPRHRASGRLRRTAPSPVPEFHWRAHYLPYLERHAIVSTPPLDVDAEALLDPDHPDHIEALVRVGESIFDVTWSDHTVVGGEVPPIDPVGTLEVRVFSGDLSEVSPPPTRGEFEVRTPQHF